MTDPTGGLGLRGRTLIRFLLTTLTTSSIDNKTGIIVDAEGTRANSYRRDCYYRER